MERRVYNPIHSDFIIHWTGGKDIDAELQPDWDEFHGKEMSADVVKAYLQRLKNILRHGLWMTLDLSDQSIEAEGVKIEKPLVPRVCFTELRLSRVRVHAKEYGRLGIGFKRFFLFDRLGMPMIYYHPSRRNWLFPPFNSSVTSNKIDFYYACYLKQMVKTPPTKGWMYNFYDESEWRIIFNEEIKKIMNMHKSPAASLFIDPKDPKTGAYHDFYCALPTNKTRPEYLIPLDSWFAMIIYPSLKIKIAASEDAEIQDLIKRIKTCYTPGCPDDEKRSRPIEVDLDACRNF